MFDYLEVVGNIELPGVDGLVKDPRLVVLPQAVKKTLGRLLPTVIDWGRL